MKQSDIDRFWSKVDRTGDCWLWLGTVSRGHCVMSVGQGAQYAVRIAWELVRGTPPQPRINLRRTCDAPLCINPDHRHPLVKQEKINIPRYKTFGDIPTTAATYYILNLINHRIYIGKTWNLQQRFRGHLSSLKSNNHQSSALQSDWNAYDEQAFEFGVLVDDCFPPNTKLPGYNSRENRIESFEDIFVRIYQSDNPAYGYNIGHFESRPGLAHTHIAKLNELADLWSIGGRRRDNETIRRCIDFTYQHIIEGEAS